jgi:hypothetical protein
MMRCVAFAHFRTAVAQVGAKLGERLGLGRVATDEFRGEETQVRAITTEPNALAHQIVMLVILAFHADHVVCAGLANLGALGTGIKTILLLRGEGRLLHTGSFYCGW